MKGSHVYVVTVTGDGSCFSLKPFAYKAFENAEDASSCVDELFEKGFLAYVTTLEVE